MADILFIKTSSLGDVIHHMPALTEARKARPDARFTWLVEEAFAPLVRLHPARRRGYPGGLAALAASRSHAPATLAEIAASLRGIRAQRYDVIVDSQGLLRSGIIARVAHGRRHGYDAAASASRSPRCSTMCATPSAAICMRSSAIACSTGRALGYKPQGAPDFGLDRARLRRSRANPTPCCCTPTARPDKQWPEDELDRTRPRARTAMDSIWCCPGAREAEHARSERIAAALPRARVTERAPLDAVARLIAGRPIRRRRRYRAAASCGSARRAAGGDFCRQQTGSDRSGRQRGRSACSACAGRAAVGGRGDIARRGKYLWTLIRPRRRAADRARG